MLKSLMSNPWLSALLGLLLLAETPTATGAQKQAAVLQVINQGISAIPGTGALVTVAKAVASAVAPPLINLAVSKLNSLGVLPASAPSTTGTTVE